MTADNEERSKTRLRTYDGGTILKFGGTDCCQQFEFGLL